MTKVKYEEDYYLWTQIMVEKLKNKASITSYLLPFTYLNCDRDD